MKPVFGTDITTDRRNDWSNSDEFIARKVCPETELLLENAGKAARGIEKKSVLPWYALVLKWLFGAAALLGLGGFINLGLDNGFGEFSQKDLPWLILFIAGGALWLALFIYGRVRDKKVNASNEAAEANAEQKRALSAARAELGVSEDAEAVDVFLLAYKLKNGKLRIDGDPFWLNGEVYAYRKDDALMLWGGEKVWAFPIENMKGIKTVRASITALCWNKKEKHKEGRFAQYKLVPNNYGLRMRFYHILELEHGGENYGIYFPCWELPVFEKLTGLNAEEAQKE